MGCRFSALFADCSVMEVIAPIGIACQGKKGCQGLSDDCDAQLGCTGYPFVKN
jgi:hypothetical protein